jgi:hypothetical protein
MAVLPPGFPDFFANTIALYTELLYTNGKQKASPVQGYHKIFAGIFPQPDRFGLLTPPFPGQCVKENCFPWIISAVH